LLHRKYLQRALLQSVRSEVLHLGHRVTTLVQEPDRVCLEFENGDSTSADVVVGADGIHSTIRQHVTADNLQPMFSGEVGFRGLIPREALPTLPSPGAIQFWIGPGAHILHYPINPDHGVVNFLAVVSRADWNEPTWRQPCDVQEVIEAFAGWHEAVTGMVGAVTEDASWWALHDFPPLRRWSSGRIVLLGDAAHAMLPHQGQGANQAIEDAYTLAQVLSADHTDDGLTAISQYTALRRARTRNAQRYSRLAAERLHVPDGPAAQRRDAQLASLDTQIAWIHKYDAQDGLTLLDPPNPENRAGQNIMTPAETVVPGERTR
jgi:salicylate hydroxylase